MAKAQAENLHQSVLPRETLDLLDLAPGKTFLDATLGLGGHAEAILSAGAGIRLIGIDQDTEAIRYAQVRLERFGDRVTIVYSNFSNVRAALRDAGIEKVDGILADLGVSSLQFDSETRGFSFRFDAPLDMRMDPDAGGETAAEMLENLPEEEIANIIYQFGEERASRRIARWIVEKRESGAPIATTKELADLVARAVRKGPKDKIHPATRTFQALRIAVNRELEILEQFINDSVDLLKKNGRLAIITFHSLEDRIVKHAFQKLAGRCFCPPRIPQCVCGAEKKVEIVTKKPVTPGRTEAQENPRSRSAKLRACMKLN
jgi:16S rRNA (cytosine1402-N4)-methyltransferase